MLVSIILLVRSKKLFINQLGFFIVQHRVVFLIKLLKQRKWCTETSWGWWCFSLVPLMLLSVFTFRVLVILMNTRKKFWLAVSWLFILYKQDHTEGYLELSAKTKTYFSTAVATWDAEFYVKVDDDVHVNLGKRKVCTFILHTSFVGIWLLLQCGLISYLEW